MDEEELRFADGPTTEVDILVNAPPDVVWALVSDITVPAGFSSELVAAEWLDGATGPSAGARFVGRSRHDAAGEWETTSVVVACEPGRLFEWAVGDPDRPGARWRFTLAPEGGGTRLTQWMQIGPGPSGITPALERMPDKESRILHRRLGEHRQNMVQTLEGIKALAEP